VTGCAGDANTGHAAVASVSTAPAAARTFAECERVGGLVASAALAATPAPGAAHAAAARREVPLDLDVPDLDPDAVAEWEAEAARAEPARAALLRCWAGWGRRLLATSASRATSWTGSVTALRWGPAVIVALPGEPFAAAAHAIRAHADPGDTVLVAGYSDGCPGYLPPAEEYTHGGYEVEEAHRYYGLPGPFAPGAAERLVAAATPLPPEGQHGGFAGTSRQ
jgi:hypothetical protein